MKNNGDKQFKYSIRKMKKGGAGSFIIGTMLFASLMVHPVEAQAGESGAESGLDQSQEVPDDGTNSQEDPSEVPSSDGGQSSDSRQPAKGHEGERPILDADADPIEMDTPTSQQEADSQISDPVFEKEYRVTINYVTEARADEAGAMTPVYPPNIIEVKASELEDGPLVLSIPDIENYTTEEDQLVLSHEFFEENNEKSIDVIYTANQYEYQVKHQVQSFNEATQEWDAWEDYETTTHRGHFGENVTVKPIDIPGYYPEKNLIETTLPDSLKEDNKTLDFDLNVRYYRDAYHVYYDTRGGNDIRTKKAIHGQAVPGVEDPVRKGYSFVGWTRNVNLPEDGVAATLLDSTAIRSMPETDVTFTAHWKENEETSYMINVWAQKADLVNPDNPQALENYDFVGRVKRDIDLETGNPPKSHSIVLNPDLTDDEVAGMEFPDLEIGDRRADQLGKYFVRNDAATIASNSQQVPLYEGATETQPRGFLKADESSVLNVIYDRALYEIYFLKPEGAGKPNRLINGIYHINGKTYEYDPDVPGSAYMAQVRYMENLMPYWPNSAVEVVLEDGTVSTELAGFTKGRQFQGFDFRIENRRNEFYDSFLSYVDNPPYRLDKRFIENAENTKDTLYGQPLKDHQRILTPIQSPEPNKVHVIHNMMLLESVDHANGVNLSDENKYDLSPLTNSRIDTNFTRYNFLAPYLRGFTVDGNDITKKQQALTARETERRIEAIQNGLRTEINPSTYEDFSTDIYYRTYLPGQPEINLRRNGWMELRYNRNKYEVHFYNSGDALSISAILEYAYETDLALQDLDQTMFDQIEGNAQNVPSEYYLFGQKIVRPADMPDHYVFTGWAMDAAGDQLLTQRDEEGHLLKRPLPAQNTPLYATWGPHKFPHDIYLDYAYDIHGVSPEEALLLDEKNPLYESGSRVSRHGLVQVPNLETLSEATLGLQINDRIDLDEQGRLIPDDISDEELAKTKRKGYVFTGWNIVVEVPQSDGSTEIIETPYAFDNEVVEDMQLKATWVRDDRVSAIINHVFYDSKGPDAKVVNTIVEYDHDLRPGTYYAAYATERGDKYIPDKNYEGVIVSEDGGHTFTFNYYPYPTRDYTISYLDEKGNKLLNDDQVTTPRRQYDVADYKPIRGYQAQTVQNQLNFSNGSMTPVIVDGKPVYQTQFIYKDVRIIERKADEISTSTPIPEGYNRIVFETDGNGTLNGPSEEKIVYDVLDGLPARALSMPDPQPKVGYTFKKWREELPTGETPLVEATYTAVFEEVKMNTSPASQNVLDNEDITPIYISLENIPEESDVNISFDGGLENYPGLTIDLKNLEITGRPEISWEDDEEVRQITIKVELVDFDGGPILDKDHRPIVNVVTIDVYRDTDGDGLPDKDTGMPHDPNNPGVEALAGDTDDDNDGIPDDQDENPKVWDELVVTPEDISPQIEGEAVPEGTLAVKVNKPNTTISSETVNGLSVDPEGNLVGKPEISDWGEDEDQRTVEIPVKVVSKGTAEDGTDEEKTVVVSVPVLRDTDGDGVPDLTDTDSDNDGIPDDQDENPKVWDELVVKPKVISPQIEGEAVPEGTPAVTVNKPNTTISSSPVNGLSVDPEGNLVGTPEISDWGQDEDQRTVEIPVKVVSKGTAEDGTDEVKTVIVSVPVLRDTDGDGVPDLTDTDSDNDGIPDDQDENPKVWDELVVTPEDISPQIEGEAVPEGTPAVTVNKPNTTISSETVNGLSVDPAGNLVGTPEISDWGEDEEERIVEIPVKVVSNGTAEDGTDEEKTVIVSVPVLRDTDGDGVPDLTDTDSDNDGIPDDQDENPKVWDELVVTPEDISPQIEGEAVSEGTPAIKVNKPNTTISSSPVNGLSVDPEGHLVGTPEITDWGEDEEERIVEIPVKVVSKGTAEDGTDEEKTVVVSVPVLRDTDGDGVPDLTDTDSDNDGIPDDQDENPKVWDELVVTPEDISPQIEGEAVPDGTPAVKVNKPNTTISSSPVNGLSVDPEGNLVGTPVISDWGEDEEERIIEIPVTVISKGTAEDGTDEVKTVVVSVPVLRDTDGDGVPDLTDTDSDNDGIPDDQDENPKVWDELVVTPEDISPQIEGEAVPEGTPAVTVNKPNTTISSSPVNGLSVDPEGNLVGTPVISDWGEDEEERIVEIPVKVVSKGTAEDGTDEEKTVIVSVPVLRDTDGDGVPDLTDTDSDNDGIPDDQDENPKVWDELVVTPEDISPQIEGEAVPDGTPAVTVNKPNTTISSETVNGLSVDPAGNLVGTPEISDWGEDEEERIVEIPVKVVLKGTAEDGTDEVKTVVVSVPVLRDTDGDGIPDLTDTDSDNDGIPDDQDENPKVWDELVVTPEDISPLIEGEVVPEGTPAVTVNKPNTTISSSPVNGLSVDPEGNLVGTPVISDWGEDEEERIVEIPVTVISKGTAEDGTDEVKTVVVSVPVLRDTDGDGIPDLTDTDSDNDGIPDDQDDRPKVWDELVVTPEDISPQIEGEAVPDGTPAVKVNKPNTTISSSPVNGLSVDPEGNLVGTPVISDWGEDEDQRTVEIPVTVISKGTAEDGTDEEKTVIVSVPVLRDTDGDGVPDLTDTDSDNDGIPDDQDENPKVWDELVVTPEDISPQIEGEAVPEGTPAVTVNKPNTTISSSPVNGLSVDPEGNLVGTPVISDWGEDEDQRTVEIPVKVVSKGTAEDGTDEVKTVVVSVPVLRDTDGDGVPDLTDTDSDNDGIPDDQDENPKVWDELVVTPEDISPQIEGEAVPDGTPAVTVNKPNTTISSSPVNGLSVDPEGHLVGTPEITDWGEVEEERIVEIPVKVVSKGTAEDGTDEEKTVLVSIPVQRLESDFFEPKYQNGVGQPGQTINIDKPEIRDSDEKIVGVPDGTVFKPGEVIPGLVVHEDGSVSFVIPEDAKDGDQIELSILVEYPNGSIARPTIIVQVLEPEEDSGKVVDDPRDQPADGAEHDENDQAQSKGEPVVKEPKEGAAKNKAQTLPQTGAAAHSLTELAGVLLGLGIVTVSKKKRDDDE